MICFIGKLLILMTFMYTEKNAMSTARVTYSKYLKTPYYGRFRRNVNPPTGEIFVVARNELYSIVSDPLIT